MLAVAGIAGLQAQRLQRALTTFPIAQPHATQVRKAASLDGTTTWGLTESTSWSSLGLGATGLEFSVAIRVPGDLLGGTTIQGINMPVVDNGIKNVSVWVRKDLNDAENLASVAVDETFSANTYVTVPLDEPVTIPAEGLYVGYSFTNSSNYCIPIASDEEFVEGGLYLQYKYQGTTYAWGDYSNQFPPTPLQLFITGFSVPDYHLSLKACGIHRYLANAQFKVPVDFKSNGANEVTSLDVDVTVGDNTQAQHIELAESVEAGLNKTGSFAVECTTPEQIGEYPIKVKVTKVNGIAYEKEAVSEGTVKTLTRMVPRRTVIEEYTGTRCQWCPRGWVGMEYLKEKYPDTFVGIAFHKYNSSDPMYYANYPMLDMTGAPQCIIDRKVMADPYYGQGKDPYGIETDFKSLNALIPEMDVDVSAMWRPDLSGVDVKADIEYLTTPCEFSVAYVLTADSLSGTTSAWKQTNGYSQYTAAQTGNEPGVSDFCKDGKYGSSTVALVFNDVVIGSSYNSSGVNLADEVDITGDVPGSIYSTSYFINAPTKTTVVNALHRELVTAVVLIIDNTTGELMNAGKARVTFPDAVTDVERDARTKESARYNAAGMRIAVPQRGLNLIRMSDGSVRKVMVK